MMFSALVSFSVIALASSAAIPDQYEGQAQIISYENKNDGSGNYAFSFETSNNMQRSERGTVVNAGLPDQHLVVEGYYSYIKPNGEPEFVRYYADENGSKYPAQAYEPYQLRSGLTEIAAEEEAVIKPVVEAKPVYVAKTIVQAAPVVETKPVFVAKTVVEPEPVVEAKPVIVAKSVVEAEAVSEEKAVVEAEPVPEVKAVVDVVPVAEAKEVVEAEAVVEAEKEEKIPAAVIANLAG